MTMLGNEFADKLRILTSQIDDALIDQGKLSYRDCILLTEGAQRLIDILDTKHNEQKESSDKEDDAKAWQANQLANKLKDAEFAISGHKSTIELQKEQLNRYEGEVESLIRTVESLVGEAHDHYLKEEKRRRRVCDLLHIPTGIEWDTIEARMEEVFGSTAKPKEESQRIGIESGSDQNGTFAVCHYRYEIRKLLDVAPDTSWKTVIKKIGEIKADVEDRTAEVERLKVELNKFGGLGYDHVRSLHEEISDMRKDWEERVARVVEKSEEARKRYLDIKGTARDDLQKREEVFNEGLSEGLNLACSFLKTTSASFFNSDSEKTDPQQPYRELISSMLINIRRMMKFIMMLENLKGIDVDPSEYVGMRIQLKIMEDVATKAGY